MKFWWRKSHRKWEYPVKFIVAEENGCLTDTSRIRGCIGWAVKVALLDDACRFSSIAASKLSSPITAPCGIDLLAILSYFLPFDYFIYSGTFINLIHRFSKMKCLFFLVLRNLPSLIYRQDIFIYDDAAKC